MGNNNGCGGCGCGCVSILAAIGVITLILYALGKIIFI
jgi:hypothetical protein